MGNCCRKGQKVGNTFDTLDLLIFLGFFTISVTLAPISSAAEECPRPTPGFLLSGIGIKETQIRGKHQRYYGFRSCHPLQPRCGPAAQWRLTAEC